MLDLYILDIEIRETSTSERMLTSHGLCTLEAY